MLDTRKLPYPQRKRLEFIDFCLLFFGQLSRADLIQHFQTGVASATRDLSQYRAMAPDNLVLRHQTKLYYKTGSFQPVFNHKADLALAEIGRRTFDFDRLPLTPSEHCIDAIRLINTRSPAVATLMQAIVQRQIVHCRYVSLSSGESERTLVPHAFANSGHRWHVRAYDRLKGEFRDFVCNRFVQTTHMSETPSQDECADADKRWKHIIPLEIIPHPRLSHPRAVELDYDMTAGSIVLDTREALLGYVTQQWRIDCSPNYRLDPKRYPLALAQPSCVDEVGDKTLLPGIKP